MKRYSQVVLVWVVLAAAATTSWAQEPEQQGSEEKTLAAASAAYVAAYNARDAEKLVSLWSPEGVYVNRSSGDQISGREAILADLQAIFAEENPGQLAVTIDSIDLISPNVALEQGVAVMTFEGEDPIETSYRTVYVKREGAWLIDRISDEELTAPPTSREKLAGLEFLIGEWVDETEAGRVEIDCQWTRNEVFLSRVFRVIDDSEEIVMSGLQIIGWDSVNESIVSWLFDSDGTVVQGIWHERDGGWHIESQATLADGIKGSFTGVLEPLEDGTHTWKKINQIVDGQLLPNLESKTIRPR